MMTARSHPFNRSTRPLLDDDFESNQNDFYYNPSGRIERIQTNTKQYITPKHNDNQFIFSDDSGVNFDDGDLFYPNNYWTESEINAAIQPNDDFNDHDYYFKPTDNRNDKLNVNNLYRNTEHNESNSNGGPFIFGVDNQQLHMNHLHEQPEPAVYKSRTRKNRLIANKNQEQINNNPTVIFNNAKYSTIPETEPSLMKESPYKNNLHTRIEVNSGENELIETRTESSAKRLFKRGNIFNRPKTKNPNNIKCVIVGEAAVGKSNLIYSYLENRFINEHHPTASDIYNFEVKVNDSPVQVTVCDTPGQDILDDLRRLIYPDSDVFLLCFSVVRPETFEAIRNKWTPTFHKSRIPIILVGTQSDLRTDHRVLNQLQQCQEAPVSSTEARDFASSIGAKYIETSSKTQSCLKELFDTAIWEAMQPNKHKDQKPMWRRLFCFC